MNIRYQYRYVTGLLKRYGFRGLVFKTLERIQSPMLSYGECYTAYLPTESELQWQKETKFDYAPLVSIVVPTYETPETYLRELIETVQGQSYENFELCLADGSQSDVVAVVAKEYAAKDTRIRYKKLEKNGGISENTNGGFAMAKGEFIALMDHDDLLVKNALYEMIRKLNLAYSKEERAYAMIYSDEDKINGDGTQYSRPHFKPDYNPQFLRHNNYFCHFLLFSAKLLEQTKGLRKEYDGAQDYDFVLRCVEAGAIVKHVPKILYHWRIHEGSTAGNSADKAYAFDNGCKAIEAHLNRIGEPGSANVTANLGVYQVTYPLNGTYKITVIAEEQKQTEYLKKCYGTVYTKDSYTLEIEYIQADSSDINIWKKCGGEYIFYLAKPISIKEKGLLEKLLRHCQHEKIAAVSAKIINKKKRVSSCGYIYRRDGAIIPAFYGLRAEYKGYFLRAVIPQNVSVVSMQCTMVKKAVLEEVGGFCEEFQGTFRSADFCLKAKEAGYEIMVAPEAVAVTTDTFSFYKRPDEFFERWGMVFMQSDECYNSNLILGMADTYRMKGKK
ncbi:MAG: glycosyltransferase [Lachnospiraceae bacterium]|nr:glycosyltransferase [Lachnospiraceae bacterium]